MSWLLGLGMPNSPWAPWADAVLEMARRLRITSALVISYDSDASADASHAGSLDGARRLLGLVPDARLLIRCYGPSEWTKEPTTWAAECARRLQPYRELGAAVELVPANEANLESELDFYAQASWLVAFAGEFRRLCPDVPLHLPALSPAVPNYWAGYGVYHITGVHRHYNVVDSHVYFGDGNQGDPDELRDVFQMDVEVTEFHFRVGDGFRDPAPWLHGLSLGNVRSAIYFIADSPDPAFDPFNLVRQPEALRLLSKYVTEEADDPMATLNDAQAAAYRLANSTVQFNPNAAICKKWLDLKKQGLLIGVPIGSEMPLDDGTVGQAFTSGAVLVWRGGDTVTVE